jgi:hypothetical protein
VVTKRDGFPHAGGDDGRPDRASTAAADADVRLSREHHREPNGTLRPDDSFIQESRSPITTSYRKSTALNAWFCVDVLTRRAAKLDKNAVTSGSPNSRG